MLRPFADVADLWTPGDGLPGTVSERFSSFAHVGLEDSVDEVLPFAPESLDLVVSALAFQFINGVPSGVDV